MFPKLIVAAILGIVAPVGFCEAVSGQTAPQPTAEPRARAGELGLNVFGLSLHVNRSAGYNEINPGVGLRYTFWDPAPQWAVFGDTSVYYDSRRHWAKYVAVGVSYRFAESWNIGLGIAYGQSQTYHHGTPFFAAVPGVAFEYRGVTFNTVLLPSESATSKIAGLAFFLTVPLGRHGVITTRSVLEKPSEASE